MDEDAYDYEDEDEPYGLSAAKRVADQKYNARFPEISLAQERLRSFPRDGNFGERCQLVRAYYKLVDDLIVEYDACGLWFPPGNHWERFWSDSSPEYELWNSIRANGQLRLHPQYPVGRWFLDVGDPVRKIGIEVDGYHHDATKDRERDSALRVLGWKIYRIPTSWFRRKVEMTEFHYHSDLDPEYIVNWLNNSVEGVLFSLWSLYYARGPFGNYYDSNHLGPDEQSFSVWGRQEMRKALDSRRLLDY